MCVNSFVPCWLSVRKHTQVKKKCIVGFCYLELIFSLPFRVCAWGWVTFLSLISSLRVLVTAIFPSLSFQSGRTKDGIISCCFCRLLLLLVLRSIHPFVFPFLITFLMFLSFGRGSTVRSLHSNFCLMTFLFVSPLSSECLCRPSPFFPPIRTVCVCVFWWPCLNSKKVFITITTECRARTGERDRQTTCSLFLRQFRWLMINLGTHYLIDLACLVHWPGVIFFEFFFALHLPTLCWPFTVIVGVHNYNWPRQMTTFGQSLECLFSLCSRWFVPLFVQHTQTNLSWCRQTSISSSLHTHSHTHTQDRLTRRHF